ncbi:MarR family winged helix-turn-helix transcriptional regulator [Bosea minatitlanensis]|uniref:MarR family winged helix-turn-helix transcriptional regulator n=1 Tax=Bosea minatitlanensis TaxID=128782 RepID=A0ABW0F5I0_9HYPH|nr:MarR family transcriptional regulator [Bosea minatitlanensis]MCT4493438.1 MarR family transcriptional regulator [Bosea minatitlanensis]
MSAEKRPAKVRRKPAARSAPPEPDGIQAPFGYVLEEQYGFLLRRAQQRYLPLFQEMMGPGGPTPTQFAALCKLAGGAEISQNRLGRLTAMDPATIKGVIGRLAERGLVERLPDPNDQRRLLIRLTEAGHAAMPELFAKAKAITIAALEPLSPAEARQIVALLTRMS